MNTDHPHGNNEHPHSVGHPNLPDDGMANEAEMAMLREKAQRNADHRRIIGFTQQHQTQPVKFNPENNNRELTPDERTHPLLMLHDLYWSARQADMECGSQQLNAARAEEWAEDNAFLMKWESEFNKHVAQLEHEIRNLKP